MSLHHGAVVLGSVHESLAALPLLVSPSLPTDVLPTLPMTAVRAEPGASVTLAPGAYTVGDFKSRVSLSLSAGIYVFDELQLQPEARVAVDLSSGPVLIIVRRELTNRATFTLSGGSALDFSLVYLGSRETQFHYPWAGRLFAPNGAVVLGSHGGFTYTGQIYVKELEIRPDSAFVCRSDDT